MIVHASERKAKRREKPWNRCDGCGMFISMKAFDIGMARRRLVSEDTAFSREAYETTCPDCRRDDE